MSRLGRSVVLKEAIPGDVVLFCIDVCGKPCHGGIFIGRDVFVHVDTRQARKVVSEKMAGQWLKRLIDIRRVI